MHICSVVGARPNFMKMGPIIKELERRQISNSLVHTGQHYDEQMSGVFFDELGIKQPDVFLHVGAGSQTEQSAKIMLGFEKTCLEQKPTAVIVAGDVNSTLAAALVATKLHIPVIHVEAGLRSFDRQMPEEINRVLVDHMSDLLFATEESALFNLNKEGISSNQVRLVGNCMIDSLKQALPTALEKSPWKRYELEKQAYALITIHRASNVDTKSQLESLIELFRQVAAEVPVILPLHPRTRKQLQEFDLALPPRVYATEALPYTIFLGLMAGALVVLTDSGGVQEETTVLDVPCLTLRNNTERPITIQLGSNHLVGYDTPLIMSLITQFKAGKRKKTQKPPLWDGKAAVRSVDAICNRYAD